MALKISSNNIPYAFSHIMELSQLPTESTYDVIFNNKTIEQAVDTTASYTTGFGEEPEDWWEEEDMLGDPDALDKARYQADNPNAIMTPWGPALAPEEVDAIIGDSPGVQELLGLTDEEIAEVTASADAIIDDSGDNFDEILSQADATAMAENLNPNEVGTGILDEMMNMPSPEDPVGSMGGGMGKMMGSPLLDDGDEQVYGDEEVSFWDMAPGTAQAVPQLSTTLVPDPLDAGDDVASADRQWLDSLLDLTDGQILSVIDEALNGLRAWLPAESVTSWVQDHPEWSYMVSTKYDLGQAALALASVKYEVPIDEGGPSAAEAAKIGGQTYGGPSEIVNKELDKIYFETTGALPDKRASEAEALFWLYRHEAVGSQFGNKDKVGSLYKPFLIDYINNRYKYTSGADFDAAVRRLSEQLTKQDAEGPDGTLYGTFVQGYFGGDDDDDKVRRKILIKLYKTGSSYGPSEMHPGIEEGMAGWALKGKSDAEIFQMYTLPRYTPGAETQYDYGDLYADDVAMALGDDTTPAYQYDRSGLRDPALSFTPELYSPGTQRFGTPGETMAMRYPRFREDPYQPPPTVYDRIGDDTNRFGEDATFNEWPYNRMVIPGINAAELPLAETLGMTDVGMPTYEGTELYKQAMQDPVMGAARRALTGQPQVPMIGVPEPLRAEHLGSMPDPFDEAERAKREQGLPYIQGIYNDAGSWVKGAHFVPTAGWQR